MIGSECTVKVTYCDTCKSQVVRSEVNLVEEGQQEEFAEGKGEEVIKDIALDVKQIWDLEDDNKTIEYILGQQFQY